LNFFNSVWPINRKKYRSLQRAKEIARHLDETLTYNNKERNESVTEEPVVIVEEDHNKYICLLLFTES